MLAEGSELADVARHLEVSEQTYHRWRNQYGGMKADDAKRLRELERENTRLKRIVADKELEIDALREISRGNWLARRDDAEPLSEMLQERLAMSQRRACRIVGQYRSTQRHRAAQADPDAVLRNHLRCFAKAHPRWGYRRAHAVLFREGYQVNRKKVQRLWREEGLRVPQKRRKRQRLGSSTTPAHRLAATTAPAPATSTPGAPWQNPWVESYGARMRDELLAIEQFDTLLEAQVLVADWRTEYNDYRPHSALGMPLCELQLWVGPPLPSELDGSGPINGVRSRFLRH